MIHDIEEALTFPMSCDRLVDLTGAEQLRITPRQSWIAVGLMGILVTAACGRGIQSAGRSAMYRAVVAGLEGHVLTHLGASVLQRGYTAGVVTALPVMLPGTLIARRELERNGDCLKFHDTVYGVALLLPAAVTCQLVARLIPQTPVAKG